MIILDSYDNLYKLFNRYQKKRFNDVKTEENNNFFLSNISSVVVDFLVNDIIKNTKNNMFSLINEYYINSNQDFYRKKKNINIDDHKIVSFSEEVESKDNKIHEFLMNRILLSYEVQTLDGKGAYIIRKLFKAYLTNPQQLPDNVLIRISNDYYKKELPGNKTTKVGEIRKKIMDELKEIDFRKILIRNIINHISTMTDDNAYKEFDKLYGTKIK